MGENFLDKNLSYDIIKSALMWPVGETVNSHAFHACTHGFESRTGHQFEIYTQKVPIAQLDRALDYGSRGWEFKSSWVRHSGSSLVW